MSSKGLGKQLKNAALHGLWIGAAFNIAGQAWRAGAEFMHVGEIIIAAFPAALASAAIAALIASIIYGLRQFNGIDDLRWHEHGLALLVVGIIGLVPLPEFYLAISGRRLPSGGEFFLLPLCGALALGVIILSRKRVDRLHEVLPIRVSRETNYALAFVILMLGALWLRFATGDAARGWQIIKNGTSARFGLEFYYGTPILLAIFILLLASVPRFSIGQSGEVQVLQRQGFPHLRWVQDVGTGESESSLHARGVWYVYVMVVGATGLLSLYSGSSLVESLFYALLAGGVLTGLWRRSGAVDAAGYPVFPGGERAGATPSYVREQCDAFVESRSNDGLHFVIEKKSLKGDLTTSSVPLADLGSFELSSHSEWLRSQADKMPNMRDWGIIVCETTSSGVLVIAEWVHDRKWLADLRAQLSAVFDGEKKLAMLDAWEADNSRGFADSKKEDGVRGQTASSSNTDHTTPRRRF